MTDKRIAVASGLISRAVELDSKEKLSESAVWYEDGIELFLQCLRSVTDKDYRLHLKNKIETYMTRAEEIKELLKKKTEGGQYHEQICITEGATGYGYQRLFGRFLANGSVSRVFVEDAYIRSSIQVERFSHFCEIIVRSKSPIRQICLTTGVDNRNPHEQLEKFKILQDDLSAVDIAFEWKFSTTLHDRKIWFDNGWVVKIGRGLDYIKNSKHKFVGLGVHDYDFRPCAQTDIDIYFDGKLCTAFGNPSQKTMT